MAIFTDEIQPKARRILLSEDIEGRSAKDIIEKIIEINEDDDRKELIFKEFVREPIQLFINSFGGVVYDGLAICDIIKQSKTPIHTIAIGSAMSMGFWIYLTGHKRYIGEHATLMFHDISQGTADKTAGIKQELNEALRLQDIILNEITSTSLIKEETLRDYITRKAEWYIPADEAIKLKLADGYYKYE